jgi:phosphoenolpyruvate carboxylase
LLQEFLLSELRGKLPLFGSDLPMSAEVKDVLDTMRVIAELPSDCFGAYVISMATAPSDVLAVELLQRECRIAKPLRVVPLFEKPLLPFHVSSQSIGTSIASMGSKRYG